MTLSILCVTKGEPHAWPFLHTISELGASLGAQTVIALDGPADDRMPAVDLTLFVHSAGYVESVLDDCLAHCRGDYILRLDDDERCSPAMVRWLKAGAYTEAKSWAFATAGLWGDAESVLVMPELWPQYHTRLSRRIIAGGQRRIHQPNPHGRGEIAPAVLEHHKFLVKSLETRRAIAARYEGIRRGAGKPCHSVPELAYDELLVAPLGDGTLRAWTDDEIRRIRPEVAA